MRDGASPSRFSASRFCDGAHTRSILLWHVPAAGIRMLHGHERAALRAAVIRTG
jgi:hypothetical protein